MDHLKLADVDTRNLWWKFNSETSTLFLSDVEQGKIVLEALQKDKIEVSKILHAAAKSAVVVSPLVQMRAKPAHQAELLSQAAFGESLLVYDQHGKWMHVQSIDGYVGWVWHEGVYFEEYLANSLIINPLGFVYEDNSFQKPLISLFAGARLEMLNSDFCILPYGRKGYVKNNVLKAIPTQQKSVDISLLISDAYRFLGLPYLWGGSKGTMLDCSGFMQLIIGFQGIIIPRDASQQALLHLEEHPFQSLYAGKLGTKSTDFMAEGAMLFFSTQNRVTHVGLSIGKGQFIHASDCIKINSLIEGDEGFAADRLTTFSYAIHLH